MVTLEQIHTALIRLTFPSTKEELIAQAKFLGEPEAVIDCLETIPEHFYGSVNTVMDALRGLE